MPRSPSSSAQQAREALAARLRAIMIDAGLNASRVAALVGWYPSKCSRLLSGETMPSAADIRAWCAACSASELADDLIAQAHAVESMYRLWRGQMRAGLLRLQTETAQLYERTTVFKVYCSDVLPGVVQTQAYAKSLLSAYAAFNDAPNDSDQAASARVERSAIIRRPGRTFALLVEEAALRHRVGGPGVMREQLRHLIDVAALPAVSLGVIPAAATRAYPMDTTFAAYDDQLVLVELLTAHVRVTVPSEVRDYLRVFELFRRDAVYGVAARQVITSAAEDAEITDI